MTMEILKVQDLCKTYGKGEAKVEALKKVSFSLDKGEFAAVVGESGSGKSTLLNCIGALDTPTTGHIWIDEQDLFSMKEEQRTIFRRRNIGFIFQSFQLVSELNVEQNIMFPLLLDYQKPDKKSVDEILDMLGLTDRRGHLPSQLSGGQQQRVAFIRCLCQPFDFILLDEPFAGVDPIAVEDIQSIVATLKNKNIGVIITDHNVDETLAITDRAYLLYEGKVLKTGSPEELAADPEVRKRYLGKHFELRRSPTIDRLRQQGAEAQRSVSETDAEATHE